MEISHDSEGRILACSPVEGTLTGENVVKVPEKEVPEDLLETFAHGKYLIRKGRIVESEGFAPAEPAADELTALLLEAVPKSEKKRPRKR